MPAIFNLAIKKEQYVIVMFHVQELEQVIAVKKFEN